MTVSFIRSAKAEATGSNGTFLPGVHVSPTIALNAFHSIESIGLASLSIFGSAVKTFAVLDRFTSVFASNRSAKSTASVSVENPGFHPVAINNLPVKDIEADGSVTNSSIQ